MNREQRAELEYLRALGFEDLYLRPRAEAQRARAPAPEVLTSLGRAPCDSAAERQSTLELVRNEALVCTACRLSETRIKVVFGAGDPNADLMFLGEGPGANEDAQGLPFVGKAGELLTRIIGAIDLEREQVYIANIVKCRPPNNRDPRPEEVAACIGYLRRQIDLVAPRVLVALGRVAAQTLLQCSTPIGRLRGRWHDFEGVPLRVTYHPAALLRSPEYKRPTWEDMQIVRDRLRELATTPKV
jgi:DNA polymerase